MHDRLAGQRLAMATSALSVTSTQEANPSPRRIDAGKEFVLESKGSWFHAGYHLTSATAGPPLLALPFAMASLGWAPGIVALAGSAAVSFYGCYLISLAAEELEARGVGCFRLWDVVFHVMGPTWAHYVVAPLQYAVCYVGVIGTILLGGQTLEGVFKDAFPSVHLKLYDYIAVFGAATLILSQVPSFHSLRFFNLLSLLLCLGFSSCTIAGCIISGLATHAPPKDYSLKGSRIEIMFSTFNAISIMVTTYANPLVVEIQATLAPPATGKMRKGLMLCYSVALFTFFSVTIVGYWAFGNSVQGVVFTSMQPLTPKWIYVLANSLACLQLIIGSVVYLQPMFAKYEGLVVDVEAGRYAVRNVVVRVLGRTLSVSIAVLFAAMLPFFADFSALLGAFGFIPLCIILPLAIYTLLYRDKKSGEYRVLWLTNMSIIVLAAAVTLMGGVASIRQIVLDANTYRLFPSL